MNRQDSIHNLIVLAIVLLLVATAIFSLSRDVSSGALVKNTYVDSINGYSFEYPGNFSTQKISELGMDVVDIYPTYEYRGVNSLIELTSFVDNEAKGDFDGDVLNLKERFGQGNVAALGKGLTPAIQTVKNESGERMITSYFKANGKIYSLRMRQLYYDNSNPLILNNNTIYTGVYFRILNSLTFS